MRPTQNIAPTAAADAIAAIGSGIPTAPPFCPPWQKFRSPATSPPGFWTAVGHDIWTGGLVMQLGTPAHPSTTPLTFGSLSAGLVEHACVEIDANDLHAAACQFNRDSTGAAAGIEHAERLS